MKDIANHPLNLLFRFVLELFLLSSFLYWGFSQNEGWSQVIYGLGLPILSATIWGIFRSKETEDTPPFKIPGYLRLILELGFFALGVWLLVISERVVVAQIFAGLIIFHYLISFQRVIRLLKKSYD